MLGSFCVISPELISSGGSKAQDLKHEGIGAKTRKRKVRFVGEVPFGSAPPWAFFFVFRGPVVASAYISEQFDVPKIELILLKIQSQIRRT